ncbi:MAG: hypothetical protein ACWA5L_03705 [bacterium]
MVKASAQVNLYLDPDYKACIDAVEANPVEGRKKALRWLSYGGGAPAKHCAAIADIANNLPKLAGSRLRVLGAKEAKRDPLIAAKLYTQAADAFLTAQLDKHALEMIDKAYELAPNSLELHIVAARVYAGTGRWGLAKRALTKAEAIAPLDSPSLVLRGRANQALTDYDAAAADVRSALNLNPDNIDALLLRGELVQIGYAIDPYVE